MPIAAIPQGVELRKISAVQKRALDDLLNKQKESTILKTAIPSAVVLIVAGGGALAYLFKDQILKWADEQKDELWLEVKKKVKEAAVATGGGVVDTVLETVEVVADAVGFKAEPKTPEYLTIGDRVIGPLSRCKRWETDAADVLAIVQAGQLTAAQTIAAAVATTGIAKQMKKEGCARPAAISQAQWDES